MSNRFSVYSSHSAGFSTSGPRPGNQGASPVSTTTLLNALHAFYNSGQPYQLDVGTSLVVNTWLTASQKTPDGHSAAIIDRELAVRAWEHARRRAEDGCIVLSSAHQSTPSVFEPFLAAVPLPTPNIAFTALAALRPFFSAVTSFNPSYSLYSALAASYTFTLQGSLVGLSFALSTSGINVRKGLLDIPSESGFRAFDVFYYLLTSASTPAEREFLALKDASTYALLRKSGTYSPPSYLPTADDAAAAEDFRASLKAIGIKGAAYRGLLSVLAGLLKLGNAAGFLVDQEVLEDVCEEVGELLGVDPEILLHKCSTDDREVLISGIYEALVDWVMAKANEVIASELRTSHGGDSGSGSAGQWSEEDTVGITVVDIPRPVFGKAVAMRSVFDDTLGINAEMKEDGVQAPLVGQSVLNDLNSSVAQVESDLGITTGAAWHEREYELDKRQQVLEKVGLEVDMDSFLRQLLFPAESEGITVGKKGRFDLATTLGSSRVWHHISIHPTDDSPNTLNPAMPTAAWSAGAVSSQLRDWRLAEWANRRLKQMDFTADFDVEEFVNRYARLGCREGRDGVESWLMERGWTNGDAFVGHQRVWMRENAWWEAETMLDLKPDEAPNAYMYANNMFDNAFSQYPATPMAESTSLLGSRDNLMQRQSMLAPSVMGGAKSIAPSVPHTVNMAGDYGLGTKGDTKKWENQLYDGDNGQYNGELDPEFGKNKHIEKKEITFGRRVWAGFVWALTFWIPSFVLRYIGRMKRPDVRMAWREKLVLVFIILFFNAVVCFYIMAFGDLLCPNKDKVWNTREVGYHQGDDDYFVSIHGKVYDISKFWRIQHSDTAFETTASAMDPFRGQNLDPYFPPPLTRFCSPMVTDLSITLSYNETFVEYPGSVHSSGPRLQADPTTKLHNITWYEDIFLPKIRQYYKGDLVWTRDTVKRQANDDQRYWVIKDQNVYDLTDYFYTYKTMNKLDAYDYLPKSVTDLFKDNAGTDVTDKWQDTPDFRNAQICLDYVFYKGKVDFRDSPKCTVNNWILLAFTVLIGAVVLVKFLAALQLGSKRRPAPQDKFVICLVPAYTEGEDALRKGLDSLTALQYDNKRKLIFVICDGMIVGGGNDRPTPKIVLDILGVDPKVDPPALPFKSIGQGSDLLNYGKVYSGLYEYEGNVVPYIVVVKVGKESEQSRPKPGNRGKRDSQILLLNFLNRVHHRSPMSPLELEMFHQINNIIGVDPELYEYCLMVDADTSVREDSLNRLVAACANDSRIAGICGETSLQNEERSWWTMIQVYEYYISHHLAKAFESLFGSVTCLPGCFCMYRLRTADKGRPLIISDNVLREYADNDIDTLHKKNLLSLGEDRFLTTLMTKYFPTMSYKFIPDAYASTAAPETWSVLLSQRRRWINSTIHNLVELAALKDLCGFCCFSMRFVVLLDLIGTVILPATCVYLGYLIYRVASHSGPIPYISLAILAGVYGLQAIIFIVKRQWQHIGWMIIYICAFPIYNFILPLYAFWKQDDFSWGSTRIVIGEKGTKRVVAVEDETFDPRSIPLQRWDDYALANNLPGRRGDFGASQEKIYSTRYGDDVALEMDDLHSNYSSVKPASTILTGFPHGRHASPYMPPQSPAPFGGNIPGNRNSHLSSFTRYTDIPQQRHMSMGNLSHYQDSPMGASRHSVGLMQSTDNLLGVARQSSRSPLAGGMNSRPVSAFDFRAGGAGPDEGAITEAIRACLAEVDLDTVTKKQVRALVEQRLQTTLAGDKKAFLDRQIDHELANM
ncbi:putative chitin synthase [Aspergillus clavatus NRRL 1]|uniref:Chitin synthase A n=1 Tax=Aspergillus clavatus (strain ATCC 1007 / CBS 513.65 / DSM 816 / NCTC 3887 / NRRL 1 / QM 1276 / 107) TaxID=344612 RepID=A1C720_ASPCL|nr:chitin synthase, putative [Aspergillus clavatus NRRL 1]EAW14191.1 chitin synthase, putative [Aspergillus clavatus NRRL 1]